MKLESMPSPDEHDPEELLPPRAQTDIFALFTKALQSGFCERSMEPVRDRAASADGVSLSSTETWSFEPILLHPLDNLKKVVQEGFCAPTEISARPKSDETNCGSTLTGGSFDSEDTHTERLADDADDDGNCFVIETHPGAGRTSRVLRSLETFIFTVLAILGTLYILQRLDINFDFQLHPKKASEVASSFISFAPRTSQKASEVASSFISFAPRTCQRASEVASSFISFAPRTCLR
jgi:hypothetical protein